MTGQDLRARVACALGAGGVALAVCCLGRADGLPSYHYVHQWPQPYAGQAQGQVAAAVALQAHNGHVLEQTFWNYYFKEGSADLRPAGRALLDRLVRREGEPVLGLYLQTARDVELSADHPGQYGRDQAALNAKRLQVISAYLAATRPDVVFTLNVHDAAPTRMAALEADGPVRELRVTAKGIIPPELQVRLSAALKGEINVGCATPNAALAGTGSGLGAFGTQATE
jgi:hypothetical protein